MEKKDAPREGDRVLAKSGDRIAKFMARAGLCSRRDAELWIAEGRVQVNGQKITSPALNVSAADKIMVDGNVVAVEEPARLWRFHKPSGTLTTNKDPRGRATVFDILPKSLPRVVTVGRLDFNTEGLLLLTNDGDLARWLEHPDTGWTRRYRARVHGKITQSIIDRLKKGVTVEGIRYRPAQVEVESTQGGNSWVAISLTEGKNREVKKLLGFFGLEVTRLIRVAYGPFQLGKLPRKDVEEVPQRVLRDTCPFKGKA
ncbi:MAG: pseudouridine synthase [Bdellovibrionales bacterium]